MLIVNPHATSTTPLRREVIARALASELDLRVVQTRYRGHAAQFAGEAAQEGYDLVLTLGGDGTVNEAVNGLLGGAGSLVVPRATPRAGEEDGNRAAQRPEAPAGGASRSGDTDEIQLQSCSCRDCRLRVRASGFR